MQKIIKLSLTLFVFCVLAGGSLAGIYLLTAPLIERNTRLAYENSVKEVVPNGAGRAVLVAPRGYGGQIEMIVGISTSGEVLGVKVLKQKETPGLGSAITKMSFLQQFIGKSLKDRLAPKEDIDTITGATISTRAVCDGIKQALKAQP